MQSRGDCMAGTGIPSPWLYSREFTADSCSLVQRCAGLIGVALNTTPVATSVPQVENTAKSSPLSFIPQISIPGSKFVAGQSITLTGATLGEYIAALYVFVVSAIGILAAMLIMYGGLKWITAGGDRGRVQDAKEQISSALVGILLAFGAYLLLLTISPKLVRFSSLELNPIPKRGSTDVTLDSGVGRAPAGTIALNGLDQAWYTSMKTAYSAYVDAAVSGTSIDPRLVYALIFIESSGNPNAENCSTGTCACGLMQVLTTTAGRTCEELKNPRVNISEGVRLLRELYNDPCPSVLRVGTSSTVQCGANLTSCSQVDHRTDPTYILAGYNGGVKANCASNSCVTAANQPKVTKWQCTLGEESGGGYSETRRYVPNVLQAFSTIRGLT